MRTRNAIMADATATPNRADSKIVVEVLLDCRDVLNAILEKLNESKG